jgi:hypothetical protein
MADRPRILACIDTSGSLTPGGQMPCKWGRKVRMNG